MYILLFLYVAITSLQKYVISLTVLISDTMLLRRYKQIVGN